MFFDSQFLTKVIIINVWRQSTTEESKPPANQGGLSKNELFQKEKVVFDEAILSIANDHWKGAKFDGSSVIAYPVLCGEDDLLYDDYEATKEFLSCPIRDIHKYDTMKKENEAMHQHLDRHLNEIVFRKCEDRTFCGESRSEEILQHFNNSQLNVKFPAPTQSKECMGHYKTFLQECMGHEGQPTAVADNLGSCQFGCKAYKFKLKTAKARHMSVFHWRQTKVRELKHVERQHDDDLNQIQWVNEKK